MNARITRHDGKAQAAAVACGQGGRARRIRKAAGIAFLLCAYLAFVLSLTWRHVTTSEFKGGRHGQFDAYRHALASAVVSRTLGEWAVNLNTRLFESGEKDSGRMDIHNNRLGAEIGAKASSFFAIEPAVREAVRQGSASADDPGKITWLPPDRWRDGRLW